MGLLPSSKFRRPEQPKRRPRPPQGETKNGPRGAQDGQKETQAPSSDTTKVRNYESEGAEPRAPPRGRRCGVSPRIHVRIAAKRLGSPTGRVCDARAQPRYVLEGQLQNIALLYIAKHPPLNDRSRELRVSSRSAARPFLSVALSLKAPLGPSFSFWGRRAMP